MELHAVKLCSFWAAKTEKLFSTVSITLTEKISDCLWLLSCLANSVSETGNSLVSDSYLFIDWAVDYAMKCKLHADKALRFWILLLLYNFQRKDNAERCLVFNLHFKSRSWKLIWLSLFARREITHTVVRNSSLLMPPSLSQYGGSEGEPWDSVPGTHNQELRLGHFPSSLQFSSWEWINEPLFSSH